MVQDQTIRPRFQYVDSFICCFCEIVYLLVNNMSMLDEADLVIIDDKLHQEYSSKQGDSIQIPCRPTRPNVTFQLIRNSQITAKGYMWEHSKV